jgi:hypothetical protein
MGEYIWSASKPETSSNFSQQNPALPKNTAEDTINDKVVFQQVDFPSREKPQHDHLWMVFGESKGNPVDLAAKVKDWVSNKMQPSDELNLVLDLPIQEGGTAKTCSSILTLYFSESDDKWNMFLNTYATEMLGSVIGPGFQSRIIFRLDFLDELRRRLKTDPNLHVEINLVDPSLQEEKDPAGFNLEKSQEYQARLDGLMQKSAAEVAVKGFDNLRRNLTGALVSYVNSWVTRSEMEEASFLNFVSKIKKEAPKSSSMVVMVSEDLISVTRGHVRRKDDRMVALLSEQAYKNLGEFSRYSATSAGYDFGTRLLKTASVGRDDLFNRILLSSLGQLALSVWAKSIDDRAEGASKDELLNFAIRTSPIASILNDLEARNLVVLGLVENLSQKQRSQMVDKIFNEFEERDLVTLVQSGIITVAEALLGVDIVQIHSIKPHLSLRYFEDTLATLRDQTIFVSPGLYKDLT